jgi:hypothetical protein
VEQKMSARPPSGDDDPAEVALIARGIATAVAPEEGLTDTQADLLEAIAASLTGVSLDYRSLEPLGPEELHGALATHDDAFRHRIVQYMVLGELVLRPLPTVVSFRVATYAKALNVEDRFVQVARRYAQGAYGLAWMDLQRNGFADHLRDAGEANAPGTSVGNENPFAPAKEDAELAERWRAFEEYPDGSLGRGILEMYEGRGFKIPGMPGGAPVYLAQHDFMHVLADYGTNLQGELEVFALIARADPDPKGFAWLATLFGLFETGYIADTGFFKRDTAGGHHADAPGMNRRIADAIQRGKVVCARTNKDLFEVDYYGLAHRSIEEVREVLGVPAKGVAALEEGSAGIFDLHGMSEQQRRFALRRSGGSD